MERLFNRYNILLDNLLLKHLTPYLIIATNFIIASATRGCIGWLLYYYAGPPTITNTRNQKNNLVHSIKVILNELVSTVELCADCAELNVVYEKHGVLVYGIILLILTYLWMSSFEDALTSPGYLAEELLQQSNQSSNPSGSAENYGRLLAQLLAAPLAWRFASFYWSFNIIEEHRDLINVEQCRSSLTTGTLIGMLIELVCSFVYRLAELLGHELLKRQRLKQTTLNWSLSLMSTTLVLIALEKSGGYFNPILASSLEFGCKGSSVGQHVVVFWLGPLLGHLGARFLFCELLDKRETIIMTNKSVKNSAESGTPRFTQSSSQPHKKQHSN